MNAVRKRDSKKENWTCTNATNILGMAEIIVAAVASCSPSLITHPIEVAKLRIQLQGELQRKIPKRIYRNVPQVKEAVPLFRN